MSNAIKPVRRIVTIDDDDGKSVAIADGPPPDVQDRSGAAGILVGAHLGHRCVAAADRPVSRCGAGLSPRT